MLKEMAILAAVAVCAPAFGASVTSITDDYETGSMTRLSIVYTPDELGLQPRDISQPPPGFPTAGWAEDVEQYGGLPYWQTWQETEALAQSLYLSQGWNHDNYMGSDFDPQTGLLTLSITEWTGESPWDYLERTGISPWGQPHFDDMVGPVDFNDLVAQLPITVDGNPQGSSPAAAPSPSALAAGLALAVAGTLRRRR